MISTGSIVSFVWESGTFTVLSVVKGNVRARSNRRIGETVIAPVAEFTLVN
jgi:hypothetical protein